jgi:HlyD family secretion protein
MGMKAPVRPLSKMATRPLASRQLRTIGWLLLSVAALAAGVGGAVLYSHLKGRTAAAPARKPGAAMLLSDRGEVTVSGTIRPQHITPVSADAEGDLDSFEVEVGQDVFEGQALARIGSSGLENARSMAEGVVNTAQQQVSRAETAVANARMESSRADADQQRSRMSFDRAEKDFEHQNTIFRAGAGSRQNFEKAQAVYQNARKDLDIMDQASRASADQLQAALNTLSAAQKSLADKTKQLDDAQNNMQSAEVRAPVEGLVVARSGELGKPATGELFEIATDMYALEVVIEPDPPVLARLRPGQAALVLIPDLQSAGISGTVKEIKGTEVVVEFNSALPALKPGMKADVRLKVN